MAVPPGPEPERPGPCLPPEPGAEGEERVWRVAYGCLFSFFFSFFLSFFFFFLTLPPLPHLLPLQSGAPVPLTEVGAAGGAAPAPHRTAPHRTAPPSPPPPAPGPQGPTRAGVAARSSPHSQPPPVRSRLPRVPLSQRPGGRGPVRRVRSPSQVAAASAELPPAKRALGDRPIHSASAAPGAVGAAGRAPRCCAAGAEGFAFWEPYPRSLSGSRFARCRAEHLRPAAPISAVLGLLLFIYFSFQFSHSSFFFFFPPFFRFSSFSSSSFLNFLFFSFSFSFLFFHLF